jgi:hypothetical protein
VIEMPFSSAPSTARLSFALRKARSVGYAPRLQAMYSIERPVGRLIEVRFWAPVAADEAAMWRRDHETMMLSSLGSYVLLVDLVDAAVLPPDMVEAYVQSMRAESRLSRAALVVGASPTLSLQIQRMMRDAPHPNRRLFRDMREAEVWLSEVVTPPERMRLREITERRSSDPGPSSAQSPPSVGAPQSTSMPPSMRGPQSVRGPLTITRMPAVGRSPSSGGQSNS